jgi:hypothetical protein
MSGTEDSLATEKMNVPCNLTGTTLSASEISDWDADDSDFVHGLACSQQERRARLGDESEHMKAHDQETRALRQELAALRSQLAKLSAENTLCCSRSPSKPLQRAGFGDQGCIDFTSLANHAAAPSLRTFRIAPNQALAPGKHVVIICQESSKFGKLGFLLHVSVDNWWGVDFEDGVQKEYMPEHLQVVDFESAPIKSALKPLEKCRYRSAPCVSASNDPAIRRAMRLAEQVRIWLEYSDSHDDSDSSSVASSQDLGSLASDCESSYSAISDATVEVDFRGGSHCMHGFPQFHR